MKIKQNKAFRMKNIRGAKVEDLLIFIHDLQNGEKDGTLELIKKKIEEDFNYMIEYEDESVIRIEVGLKVIPLINKMTITGEQIERLRKKIFSKYGYKIPPIRIIDNSMIKPLDACRLYIKDRCMKETESIKSLEILIQIIEQIISEDLDAKEHSLLLREESQSTFEWI